MTLILIVKTTVIHYSLFVDEETQLTTQRDRLYKEEDSVLELMRSLDDQKDATLHKTFENVNMHFKQVKGDKDRDRNRIAFQHCIFYIVLVVICCCLFVGVF